MTQKYKLPNVNLSAGGVYKSSFRAFYKWYAANNGNIKDHKIAKKAFKKITDKIWYEIVVNLWALKMPHGMGEFYIVDNGQVKKYIDWQRTRKASKLVRGVNMNLNGRKPYLKWNKGTFKHSGLYNLQSYKGGAKNLPHTGHRGMWKYINSLPNPNYRPNIV